MGKHTVRLNDDDERRLDAIRRAIPTCTTKAKAIRHAIKVADGGLDSDALRFAIQIAQWADGLVFTNEREKRELRSIVAELYKVATASNPNLKWPLERFK